MSGNCDTGLAAKLDKLDIREPGDDEKPAQVQRRTGLVYDERMKKHSNIWDKDHMEVPDRVGRPFNKHVEYGLLERCYRIPSRFATEDELSIFHSKKHIEKMKSTQGMKTRDLFILGEEFDSIYMSEVSGQLKAVHDKKDGKTKEYLTQLGDKYESDYLSEHVYECALLACGCTLEAVEHVATNKVQNAVAIVRPPGHHADSDSAMGYCYFNNVAIAAKIAQQKWGMKKVLIVDWDIHHGNGTQSLFESDPSVLYFSIHEYQHAKFYPFSTIANYDVVGEGPGKGFNINVPWNKFHMGDADYLAAFQHVLLPIAYEFDPDIVLVSAGFDSARGDPKGHCDITPEGYCHLTNMLMSLAGGKVVIILEGGYNLTSVEESMCSCTSTLLGDPCPRLEEGPLLPSKSAMESLKNVISAHKPYWKCLEFVDVSIPDVEEKEEKRDKTRNGENVVSEDLMGKGSKQVIFLTP